MYQLRMSMEESQFLEKTVDLDDGLDPLLPAVHPHIGEYARYDLRTS